MCIKVSKKKKITCLTFYAFYSFYSFYSFYACEITPNNLIYYTTFSTTDDFMLNLKLQHISNQFLQVVIYVRKHWSTDLVFCQKGLEETANKTEKVEFSNSKHVIDSFLDLQKAFGGRLLTFW